MKIINACLFIIVMFFVLGTTAFSAGKPVHMLPLDGGSGGSGGICLSVNSSNFVSVTPVNLVPEAWREIDYEVGLAQLVNVAGFDMTIPSGTFTTRNGLNWSVDGGCFTNIQSLVNLIPSTCQTVQTVKDSSATLAADTLRVLLFS